MACKTCGGKGNVKCPKCKGTGRIVPVIAASHDCPQCHGSGLKKCGACGGSGR